MVREDQKKSAAIEKARLEVEYKKIMNEKTQLGKGSEPGYRFCFFFIVIIKCVK